MKFTADPFQNQTPQLMDLEFSTIKSLDERSGLSTPATRTRRPTDGSHWITKDHVFGEATAVVMRQEKSYHDYNYKNELQIWK